MISFDEMKDLKIRETWFHYFSSTVGANNLKFGMKVVSFKT